MQTKIAIATGGSGGHVFPALALCEQFKHRDVEYVIIADQRVTSLLQQENARILNIQSTSGKLYKKCIALFSILIATKKVISIFEQEKPHAVVGFGGYPSAPTILAAILLKIPFILHEQNTVIGLVNKLFFRAAQAVATSFPVTEGLPTDKALFIGNPVRNSVLRLFNVGYEPDINRPINILVIGGSQGSNEIDNLVTKTVTENALQHRINIVHQCRPENLQNVIQSYQQANIIHEVSPFFQDMAGKLKDADLIICRAGATTMAENIIAGRPAIYVPLRQSYQDHQTKNARFAALNNIGVFFDAENDSLGAILNSLISNPDKLHGMSEAARAMAKPDAATKLAELVLKHARLKLLA